VMQGHDLLGDVGLESIVGVGELRENVNHCSSLRSRIRGGEIEQNRQNL
jgi:hypothetical protein